MNATGMTRELRQLAHGFIMACGVVVLITIFYGVMQSESLTNRTDNPRRVIDEQTLQRGMIVDRNGIVLATSSPTKFGDRLRRIYPYPEVIGGVGYFGYVHGTSGLEARFDDLLSGEWERFDLWDELAQELLHQQPEGGDLRTTLDLRIQQTLTRSIGNRDGAAVVIHVPDGAVLAMVSRAALDPNTVDENWDDFGGNQRQRLLHNRVTEGLYRPGSTLELALLAGMLASGDSLDRVVEDGTATMQIDGQAFLSEIAGCVDQRAAELAEEPLLKEVFAWGCPPAFVEALEQSLILEVYNGLMHQLGLLEAPELFGFRTVAGRAFEFPTVSKELMAEAIGQGYLRVTPLQLARLVAAIAHEGSAPPLHLADSYRLGGDRRWQPLDRPMLEKALMREETAAQLQEALRFAAENSLLVGLADDLDLAEQGYNLHGQVGVTYTAAQGFHSWFLGFMDAPDGSSVVVVVLIENAQSPGEAAMVAGDAFRVTVDSLYE